MKCPYCGHENDTWSTRCAKCGRSLKRLKKEQRTIRRAVIGVILVIILAAAALLLIGSHLKRPAAENISTTSTSASSTEKQQSTTAESSTSTSQMPEGSIGYESKKAEDTDKAIKSGKLAASISGQNGAEDRDDLTRIKVASSKATSWLNHSSNFEASKAFDDDDSTSWQEGDSGDGIQASITCTFDKSESVRYLVIKPGNWKTDSSYKKNNRPKKLTVIFDKESAEITLPNQKAAYLIELSKTVQTKEITFRVDEVYRGSSFRDTCIAGIEVYGKK